MKAERIAVIGGGMSGLSAAVLLARDGCDVTVFERQERIGKKLLITGNGRCNLSNEDISADHYQCGDMQKLSRILSGMSAAERDHFYESLGLSICNVKGGLYPVSRQASSVIDAFRFTFTELGVKIMIGYKACALREGGRISFENVDKQTDKPFDAVILSCGGKAGVYGEEKGNAFPLLKKAGHSIKETYPALTYLKCREDLKSVAGVRCDAQLRLKTQSGIYTEKGELQLNKDSVSGIPVFQLSRFAPDPGAVQLEADFLCFIKEGKEEYERRVRLYPNRTLEDFFAGWLNKKLAVYLIKKAGLRPSDTVKISDMERLYRTARHCSFDICGRGNYREAQLMCGGVPLSEVNDDLESLCMKNVYLCGELLDVAGECGGYNLHFALCCAHTVWKAIRSKGEN